MLKPQKKLSKKEIKEDKFVKTAMQARSYLEENYKKVTGITAAIFGVIILIMAYSYIHGKTVQDANALLGKAQLEYQNMNYTKARNFLLDLFDSYSGTDAAEQGKFLIANLFYQQNDIPQAKEYFNEFIEEYSGSPILLASGYAGYAACLEKEKNHAEAAEYYLKAFDKDKNFVEAPDYLYLAGKNYIDAGDIQKARESFEKIEKDFEKSTRYDDAKVQLILLANK